MRNRIALAVVLLLCVTTFAQNGQPQKSSDQSMPGMDMSHHDMSNMKTDSDKDAESDAGPHAMNSMEGHMDMGPHMKMTSLHAAKPGDADRAQKIVEAARQAAQQYLDYHKALDDGFKIFHPEIPQGMYHFTSSRNAIEAQFRFNPEHPTSLLYEKHGDDYKLVGVMYTAPKRFTEDDLDQRIPLSIAQWHEHVNFCKAPDSMTPAERREAYLGKNAKFGLKGAIDTPEACNAAGGTFRPVIFNWMVHLYPFEKDPAQIWSVERQHGDAD